jgi:hypothetical protein
MVREEVHSNRTKKSQFLLGSAVLVLAFCLRRLVIDSTSLDSYGQATITNVSHLLPPPGLADSKTFDKDEDESSGGAQILLSANNDELQPQLHTLLPNGTKTPPTAVGDEFKIVIDENLSGVSNISSVGDTKFKASMECRLDLEKRHNLFIDQWLQAEVPLLSEVITINDKHHVLLQLTHLQGRSSPQSWREATWFCNQNETAKILQVPQQTRKAKRNSGLMVLTCNSSSPISAVWPSIVSKKTGETPHYDVRPYLTCDELDRMKAPPSHVKIGACVQFRGEWDRQVMEQWIEYHRLIGIQHFWVYINEPADHLRDLPQREYVTYIPNNYNWGDHKMHSKYKLREDHFFQTAMQMQCIYRAKRYKLDWVATTDVDEYIRVMSPHPTTNNITVSPLQYLLNSIPNRHLIGGLSMNSIPFGRNLLLDPANKTIPLVMDHVWRNKKDPEDVKWARRKLIYNPQIALDVGIHDVFRGGQERHLKVKSQAFLQHYKQVDRGVFQSSNSSDLVMDTELRDQYRDRVVVAMNRTRVHRPLELNES